MLICLKVVMDRWKGVLLVLIHVHINFAIFDAVLLLLERPAN